jgi:hypothetical protein
LLPLEDDFSSCEGFLFNRIFKPVEKNIFKIMNKINRLFLFLASSIVIIVCNAQNVTITTGQTDIFGNKTTTVKDQSGNFNATGAKTERKVRKAINALCGFIFAYFALKNELKRPVENDPDREPAVLSCQACAYIVEKNLKKK